MKFQFRFQSRNHNNSISHTLLTRRRRRCRFEEARRETCRSRSRGRRRTERAERVVRRTPRGGVVRVARVTLDAGLWGAVIHQAEFQGYPSRLCCIEIQARSILDRDQFLALYLARRSIFWASPMQKILFPYTKDTFCGSLDTEPVSCICIADPNFMYRAQPCKARYCVICCCFKYSIFCTGQFKVRISDTDCPV